MKDEIIRQLKAGSKGRKAGEPVSRGTKARYQDPPAVRAQRVGVATRQAGKKAKKAAKTQAILEPWLAKHAERQQQQQRQGSQATTGTGQPGKQPVTPRVSATGTRKPRKRVADAGTTAAATKVSSINIPLALLVQEWTETQVALFG
jgi:hypothetical protein